MTIGRGSLVLAACAALVLATGCGDDKDSASTAGDRFGPAVDVGDGTAKSFVTVDEDGNPTAIGIRLSETALSGLPSEGMPMYSLGLPDDVDAAPFDFVMIDWQSRGHVPLNLFGQPHFDMHFYMQDEATVEAIAPDDPSYEAKATHYPDEKYIPAGYIVPGPPLEATVPAMGLHWVDSAGGFGPDYAFTQVLINGTWDGAYTFIEPMVTLDYLLTKPTFSEELKLPQAYQESGYYPTTYSISFDETAKEIVVTLGGMTERTAS